MAFALERPIGMGCMRLSAVSEQDEERAENVLHAALDGGVTLLDTADVYGRSDGDVGHNERLVAAALRSWKGDASRVVVATKGGLTRPGGRWTPNGSAKHLRAACEASLQALGLPRIALYQLHTPDPRLSLKTSIGALVELQQAGLIERIGLCNVDRDQLALALGMADIAAVQVGLSPFDDESLYGGVVELCREAGIALLAHTPLGGPKKAAKIAAHVALKRVAARHGISPAEAALAWSRDLADVVVPIPGASTVSSARSIGRAAQVALADIDRDELDAAIAASHWWRHKARLEPPAGSEVEVVLLMGIQGAGKSHAARDFVERGYERLNRDTLGGKLSSLATPLSKGLAAGQRRWVLDNTFARRSARARIVHAVWKHATPVRCIVMDTSLGDAQINAVRRMLERYGALPEPEQIKQLSRSDPHAFAPNTLFRYQRELQPPTQDEGFVAIEHLPFEREPSAHEDKGVLFQLEGVLRESRSGERSPLTVADMRVRTERAARLAELEKQGYKLLAFSWQPAIAEGRATREQVDEVVAFTVAELGVGLDVAYCPHGGGPPRCWCRTPLPGLAVQLIDRHHLDPAKCMLVGRPAADKTLAQRMGFVYASEDEMFGD